MFANDERISQKAWNGLARDTFSADSHLRTVKIAYNSLLNASAGHRQNQPGVETGLALHI